MKSVAVLFILIIVSIMAGCSSIDVMTDFNTEWDFGPYKTYDWVAAKSPSLRDPLLETSFLDKRVKNAVERELGIKGYQKSVDDPDFLISFHIGSKSQVDVSTCGYHYPTSPHCWGGDVDTHIYSEGSLILDFIDFKEEELVWRGSAKGALYQNENSEETLNKAVAKMLKSFPPK